MRNFDHLKEGKEYVIDVECANGGVITLVSKGKLFCQVKDEKTGGQWETSLYRLSEIPNWVKKHLRQYPIGGYAPGNYMNHCVTCKEEFFGDKLAIQCETCALKLTKEIENKDTTIFP